MYVSNTFGTRIYTVAFREEPGKLGPVLCFYPEGWEDRIGKSIAFSYVAEHLLDREKDSPMMLDRGDMYSKISAREMERVQMFIRRELQTQ